MLTSTNVLVSDVAVFLNGPQRSMLLGIQQAVMLVGLALDYIDPKE